MSHSDSTFSRRTFLNGTAIATASGAMGFQIVPNSVLAQSGRTSPNDRIVAGNIGVGGRGRGFLRPGVTAAICDVDDNRMAQAAERVGGNPRLYKDYRELLDQDDIDAVFVTTPDHWHAQMTVHACEAGKDVYVEKPASCTIEEGRAMVNAAKRYARVVQVGSQGRSQEGAYHGHKYIANGQIGHVDKVVCWHYENPRADLTPIQPPPHDLDYEKWVGPARWIPYHPRRTHGSFRWMLYTGGGQIRDRGAHVMSVAMWIMNSDHTGPAEVEATGMPYAESLYDVPETMRVVYRFKDPDWELIWEMPGTPHEEGFEWVRGSYGAVYNGDKDDLIITYGDTAHTDTEQKAKDYEVPADGVEVFHSPGHRENFENCIRTREDPIMHIEAGHRVATLCILGNLAYRLGRKLEWDPVNEVVKNDDEANRLLRRPGRGEWQL